MAELTEISGTATDYFAMPHQCQLMGSTAAGIGKTLVLPGRNAFQAITARRLGAAAQVSHNLLPLLSMGLDSAQAIEAVDNIVRHLMNDCVANIVLIVLGEQPGVVAYARTLATHLIHAGALTSQIKIHLQRAEVSAIERRGPGYTVLSRCDYLAALLLGNRVNIGGGIHCLIIKTAGAGTMPAGF